MKVTCLLLLSLCQLLYGLSWAILFGGVVLMCFRPNPSEAMLTAIMVTIMGAFWYIAAYVVLRGMVRLFGYGHPAVPVPQQPVVIRRMILEEVTPLDAGQPAYRVVQEEVTPTEERPRDAR